MKLFLSGGGSGESSIELDRLFAESLDKTKPVLYIPIAIDTTRHPYPECLKWIKSSFKPLGLENIVMWTEIELRKAKSTDFNKFSGVYIGGGNTFKLLKELKEFGTFEILRKLAKKDIPIYGGSAGAIIFAKTIIPAISADPNDVGLTDLSALNLISGYDLFAHYEPSQDEMIREYIGKFNLQKVVAVPEDCGLFVGNRIKIIGKSSAYVFNKSGRNEISVDNFLV